MSAPRRLAGGLLALLFLLGPAAAQERPVSGEAEGAGARGETALLDDARLRDEAFAPARLRARRAALLAALPEGAVLVLGTPARPDDIFPYRVAPNFLYLTGQRTDGMTLLLAEGEDVLFAPTRDPAYERWNGPRLAVGTPEAAASGFGEVVARAQRAERIAAALERCGGPLILDGVTLEELALEAPPAAVRPLRAELARLRQVKDPAELALLQGAIDITCAALREAAASLRPGQREHELQGVIEYVFLRYGAQRPGFASIVGSGPNSCVLHYSDNRRVMRAGELVVCDVGAELWGYSADVTRTFPVGGEFTARQREIYELVLRAQEAGIAAVKPGASMRDVDRAAREVIAEAGYGRYFFHGTSHWLGLDVHDVGPMGVTLRPGMVLTVEPGIYLASEDLGVRIEDDVLVTEDGRRLLSAGVPRTVDEVEALLTGAGVGARAVAPLPAHEGDEAQGEGEGRRFFYRAPR